MASLIRQHAIFNEWKWVRKCVNHAFQPRCPSCFSLCIILLQLNQPGQWTKPENICTERPTKRFTILSNLIWDRLCYHLEVQSLSIYLFVCHSTPNSHGDVNILCPSSQPRDNTKSSPTDVPLFPVTIQTPFQSTQSHSSKYLFPRIPTPIFAQNSRFRNRTPSSSQGSPR